MPFFSQSLVVRCHQLSGPLTYLMALFDNCKKLFTQLFRWKNAKGNGLLVGGTKNRAASLAKCPSF